jgi:hypothetical protein
MLNRAEFVGIKPPGSSAKRYTAVRSLAFLSYLYQNLTIKTGATQPLNAVFLYMFQQVFVLDGFVTVQVDPLRNG